MDQGFIERATNERRMMQAMDQKAIGGAMDGASKGEISERFDVFFLLLITPNSSF